MYSSKLNTQLKISLTRCFQMNIWGGKANETKVKQVEKPRQQCLVWEVGEPHPIRHHPPHPAALTGCHTSSPRPPHFTLPWQKEIIGCSHSRDACLQWCAAKNLLTQLTFAQTKAEDFASGLTVCQCAVTTQWRERPFSVFKLGQPTVAVKENDH